MELKPDYVNALYNRGNAYRHLHQYDKAIADYSKAIELSPDDADAWTNRGLAYAGLASMTRPSPSTPRPSS